MDNGNRDVIAVEAGRVNQGFELTNQNTNDPDHIVERNLRNDLEAQRRHRANAVPINDVNVTSVTPSFSRIPEGVGGGDGQDSNTDGSDSTRVVPTTERPISTRTYIEVTQDPSGVNKFLFKLDS